MLWIGIFGLLKTIPKGYNTLQFDEHMTVNPRVVGSSSTRGTILVPKTLRFRNFFMSFLPVLPKFCLFYTLLRFLKKL